MNEERLVIGNDVSGGVSTALARVAAAIAIGASPDTIRTLTNKGLLAGATEDQIVRTLFATAPLVGSARLMSAAPDIARAVGYDIDQVIENLD